MKDSDIVYWQDRVKRLEARLAEAERAIESAGRCLVMSNNGPREALEILRRYKATTASADACSCGTVTHQSLVGRALNCPMHGLANSASVSQEQK